MEPLNHAEVNALRLATKDTNPKGVITARGSVKESLIKRGYAEKDPTRGPVRGTLYITQAGRDAIARHDNKGQPSEEAALAEQQPEEPETGTAKQVAALIGRSLSTIYRWIKTGKLTARKIAGRWAVTLPAAA